MTSESEIRDRLAAKLACDISHAAGRQLKQAKYHLDRAAAELPEGPRQRRLVALALEVEQEVHNVLPAHADDSRWKASGPDGTGYPAHNPNQEND